MPDQEVETSGSNRWLGGPTPIKFDGGSEAMVEGKTAPECKKLQGYGFGNPPPKYLIQKIHHKNIYSRRLLANMRSHIASLSMLSPELEILACAKWFEGTLPLARMPIFPPTYVGQK